MTEPPAPPSALADALAAVQSDLPRIKKDQTANAGQYSYSYADLTDVSAAVLPLLGKHGLSFTAFPTLNAAGAFVLRYHLLHVSGERETGEYPLPTGNPQAIGSAITYARRYCLCAVTGVSPDDDDDAAAAVAGQQAEVSQELSDARDSVRGAWAHQYGAWDQTEAGKMFHHWSKGGKLLEAPPARLKAFAAFIASQPANTAGSTPEPPAEPPAEVERETRPAGLSGRMRGKLFAELAEFGIKEDQDQRDYMTTILGREIKSRSDLTAEDAKRLIDDLERRKAGEPS
jgi:hypothetical protein